MIDKTLLINAMGYFTIYISTIQNMLNILNSPNSNESEKIDAEKKINDDVVNLVKLINTINIKCGNTHNTNTLTDIELSKKGII